MLMCETDPFFHLLHGEVFSLGAKAESLSADVNGVRPKITAVFSISRLAGRTSSSGCLLIVLFLSIFLRLPPLHLPEDDRCLQLRVVFQFIQIFPHPCVDRPVAPFHGEPGFDHVAVLHHIVGYQAAVRREQPEDLRKEMDILSFAASMKIKS